MENAPLLSWYIHIFVLVHVYWNWLIWNIHVHLSFTSFDVCVILTKLQQIVLLHLPSLITLLTIFFLSFHTFSSLWPIHLDLLFILHALWTLYLDLSPFCIFTFCWKSLYYWLIHVLLYTHWHLNFLTTHHHIPLSPLTFHLVTPNPQCNTSRLATNNGHFMTAVLGISDPIHRQKICLKAMDVVLFGPPKRKLTTRNQTRQWYDKHDLLTPVLCLLCFSPSIPHSLLFSFLLLYYFVFFCILCSLLPHECLCFCLIFFFFFFFTFSTFLQLLHGLLLAAFWLECMYYPTVSLSSYCMGHFEHLFAIFCPSLMASRSFPFFTISISPLS